MKNICKICVLAISFFSILFLPLANVEAGEISAGVLKIEYASAPGPLFNPTNISPGYVETKTLTVKNTGSVPHSFSIAVSGDLGILADAITIEPRVLGKVVWNKTISQIAKHPESNSIISSIAPGGTVTIEITATLPESVGNEYQGTSTLAFNFLVGNEDDNDQKEPGTQDQDDPNIVQRVVNRVRGVFQRNDNQPAANGVTSNDATQGSDNGTVSGVSSEDESLGEQTSNKPVCFWWWLLSIIFVIFLVVYGYFVRKIKTIFAWLWPIFVGGVLYAIHWILHSYYIPSKWCVYFIFIEIILLTLYYLSQYYLGKAKSEEE